MTDKVSCLKAAGKVAHNLHLEIAQMAKIGTNLLEIEKFSKDYIQKAGMEPSFLGYKGYPAATCLSINDQVVHAIPRDYELKKGDLLSVDLGVTYKGWIVDTARSHIVGNNDTAYGLIQSTTRALTEAIELCQPGHKIGDLGDKISSIIEGDGYAVINELHGHGVGRHLQEPPSIPNYGNSGQGRRIEEGMVLALEPITCLKPTQIGVREDGWTIIALNGQLCAHVEDTIMVTKTKPIILT